jgi:hypothetical protein
LLEQEGRRDKARDPDKTLRQNLSVFFASKKAVILDNTLFQRSDIRAAGSSVS